MFSGAQGTRIISFPCIASTNCNTLHTRIKLVVCRIHLAGCQLAIPFSPSPHLTNSAKASSFSRLQPVLLAFSSNCCHHALARATANCLCKVPSSSRNTSRLTKRSREQVQKIFQGTSAYHLNTINYVHLT